MARKDYPAAIAQLEEAVALDPASDALHYPLALAYRGAGQLEKAQLHLRPQNNGDVKPPDFDAQCEAMLVGAIHACERYYPAFQFVVWAGKSAAEAMSAAMFDTEGEA